MTTRRALLGVAAGVVPANSGIHAMPAKPDERLTRLHPHPDAALLALCARLEKMRAEWQRLYDATSDHDELTTPADHAWQAYSDDVWPRLARQPIGCASEDLPGLLPTHRATTVDGLRAKAAALLAMDAAASYCDLRDDSYELTMSLLRDAAGPAFQPLGADLTPLRPVTPAI